MSSRKGASFSHALVGIPILALLAAGCGRPSTDASPAAGPTPAAVQPTAPKRPSFEVVSAERVDFLNSNAAGGRTASWPADGDETGLLMVLKLSAKESVEYYSSDFSLGYEDPQGIPRSACMGLSMGLADPGIVKQASWMLGGSMSRGWASTEKPYFGLLFSVPRKVTKVSLFGVTPLAPDIPTGPGGEKK